MNHLINKFKIAGALGGKPKPKPATLLPPELGVHQLGSSFSYAEILDLISDGPIAGLVNQNNSRVNGLSALQGIYMDDIPVAVTNDQAAGGESIFSFEFYETTTPKIASHISDLGTQIKKSTVRATTRTSYDQGFRVVDSYGFSTGIYTKYLSIDDWTFDSNSLEYILYTRNGYAQALCLFIPKQTPKFYKSPYLYSVSGGVINFVRNNQGFKEMQDLNYLNSYQKAYTDALVLDKPEEQSLTEYIENQIQNLTKIIGDLTKNTTSALYIDASRINFDSSANPRAFINEDGSVKTDLVLSIDPKTGFQTIDVLNYTYPELDENGDWNGKMKGFIVYFLKTVWIYKKVKSGVAKNHYSSIHIEKLDIDIISNFRNFIIGPKTKSNSQNTQKYNYTNILTEIKKGEEDQKPFRYFNNVYIDKTYDSRLLGPFRTSGQVQKLYSEAATDALRAQKLLTSNFEFNNPTGKQKGLPIDEGSNDTRKKDNR
jgi:hypothetical protein